jgi:hypothetical protein
MSYSNLSSERLDNVSYITLNRPESLNALSYELLRELDEQLTKIEDDDSACAVIITGAGLRAFSSGGDIVQMVRSAPDELGRAQIFALKRPGMSPILPSRSSAPSTVSPTAPVQSWLRSWIFASGASTPSSVLSRRSMAVPTRRGRCLMWLASQRPRSFFSIALKVKLPESPGQAGGLPTIN